MKNIIFNTQFFIKISILNLVPTRWNDVVHLKDDNLVELFFGWLTDSWNANKTWRLLVSNLCMRIKIIIIKIV